jgi:hypothetical protein
LRAAYDRAAYDMSIDYREAPNPPLNADGTWANQLLRQKKLR